MKVALECCYTYKWKVLNRLFVCLVVFNATVNNILVISPTTIRSWARRPLFTMGEWKPSLLLETSHNAQYR